MKVQLSPYFHRKIKKENIRIQKSFKEAILLFAKDPFHPQLNNHYLHNEWEGFRSINVTGDYRAIYEEINENDIKFAYFVNIDTHRELYQKKKRVN